MSWILVFKHGIVLGHRLFDYATKNRIWTDALNLEGCGIFSCGRMHYDKILLTAREGAAFGRKFWSQWWEYYNRSIQYNLETDSSFPLGRRKSWKTLIKLAGRKKFLMNISSKPSRLATGSDVNVNKDGGGVNGLSLLQGPEVSSHVNKPNLPLPPLALRR